MNMPTWEQFSSVFENPRRSKVRKVQAALIASHPETLDGHGPDDDYLSLFGYVFGVPLDWKEGIFVLLERLAEYLGSDVLQIEFDDDYELAIVRFGGRECQFDCADSNSETFDADVDRLQSLMKEVYVFKLFYEGGIDDMLLFLVIPTSMWAQAQKRYGNARISACFISYNSPISIGTPYDATLRWKAPRGRIPASRVGIPVLLAACIGAAIPLINIYNAHDRAKANAIPTCESLKKVVGRLKKPQADALIADFRRTNSCR